MAGPNDFYIENGVLKGGVRPAEKPKAKQEKEPKATTNRDNDKGES